MEMTRSPSSSAEAGTSTTANHLLPVVVMLFFGWGFATVLIDTLIPKLKGLFSLSYTEVMLTQFSFFLGYLVFSIPAGKVLARIGYLRTIVVGLLVMVAGCLLFAPAAAHGRFEGFLMALFIMAAGITTLQVAANPLIALIGRPERAHSRLNLAQAFNSLGTTLGPLVGAALILSGGVEHPDIESMASDALAAYRIQESAVVQLPFLGIAAVLTVLAVVFWLLRRSPAVPGSVHEEAHGSAWPLLRRPRLALGVLSIFLYVGAEVSIGSLMVNYLMQPEVMAVTAAAAGSMVSLYWGGAMVGRFIGAVALRFIAAGRVLAVCAFAAMALAAASAASTGPTAGFLLLAVGLCNSIMFPTIFTLALEGLGKETPGGSSLLCMAIVGGAIVPVATGHVADIATLSVALCVPAACYLLIALYGLLERRTAHSPQ